ncbi:MAG: methyltransferase domain-containing protein [Staphylothermus sp.]|nr:methyltransferase domain-containing protein [Staphylothermus sp.]
MLNHYEFKPVKGYWFTKYLLDLLWSKRGCFTTTLDIGITWKSVCVENNRVIVDDEEIFLDVIVLKENDRVIYYKNNDVFYEITRRTTSGFYKLKAIGLDKAPTVEINGIHMHKIKGIDPWSDSRRKTIAAKIRRGDIVLDTCMGLGYTAIHSVLRGASKVYTVEVDENIIWIAEHNPWSHGLSDNRITIIHDDICNTIREFEDSSIDRIIHDPPRFSKSTGNLYSYELYREFYRVLKPGGIIYHYTGEPRRHGVPSILKGISERLRKAGFYPVYYRGDIEGFIGVKPKI